MMLSQVTQRLSKLDEQVQRRVAQGYASAAREIVAGIVSVGSPRRGVLIQTLGLHIPETMRLQLLHEKKRWGLRTYRDVCYVALQIGLEILKANIPQEEPEAQVPQSTQKPRPVPVAGPCVKCGELKKPGALACLECGDGLMSLSRPG
jgi:hypothetical protein